MTSKRIRLNLVANFGAQGWRALMSLVFVPFYVRILGVEAYGLIGLFLSLQMALGLLDAGLRPTLAREMARFSGGAHNVVGIRTLLHSVELIMLTIAISIVIGMAIVSPWLAAHWVNTEQIPVAHVARAFAVMGVVAGAQLLESTYDSALSGLQRQVEQNVIITIAATLRGVGALLILLQWPSISAYFVWQALVSLASLLTLRTAVLRSLSPAPIRVRFSLNELLGIRRYALGVFAQTLLMVVLIQSDRLILARLTSLRELGGYAIAAAVGGMLAFITTPIGRAYFPRFTELTERGDVRGLESTFYQATKLLVIFGATYCAMITLFGERLMRLWLNDAELASRVAPLLALLAVGNLFWALLEITNLLQLANGRTSLILRMNLGMLAIYLPLLFFAASSSGAIGAAASWAAIHFFGMVVGSSLALRCYLPGKTRNWWFGNILPITIITFGTGALLRIFLPKLTNPVFEGALLLATSLCILFSGILADRGFRHTAWDLLRAIKGS